MLVQTYLLGLTVVVSYHGLLMAATSAGRKYTLFKNRHTWNEARDICIKSNMGMLKIVSDAEMNGFKKVLAPWISDGKLSSDMWLGLYDKDPTGPAFVHYWQYDCAPLGTYAPWYANVEPDGKGNENCVRITKDGIFKTKTCPSELPVICQENTDHCWFEEYAQKKISNLAIFKSATMNLRECKTMCLKTTAEGKECVAASHDGTDCSIYIAESTYVITLPTMTEDHGYITLVKRCYTGTYKEAVPTVVENKATVAENECTTTTFSSTTPSTPTTASTTPTSIPALTTTTPASTTAETTTTTVAVISTTVSTSTSASESTSSMSSSSTSPTTTLTSTTASTTAATTPATESASDTTTPTPTSSTTDANPTPPAATTLVPIISAVSTTASTTVSFTVTTAAATTISTPASMTSPTPATTTMTTVTAVSPLESPLCDNSGSSPGPDNNTCAAICVAIAGPNSPEWQALMRALILNRKMLSSYRRAKTSAKDDRPSAGTLGASGIGILVLVFGSLILLDLDRFVSMIHQWYKMPRRNKFRTFSLAKDL